MAKERGEEKKIIDSLTWWGFLLVCMMAGAFAFDYFGETGGYIAFWLILLIVARIFNWWGELQEFRFMAKIEIERNIEAATHKGKRK